MGSNGSWNQASGSGGSSGGYSATWSYSGSGSYWEGAADGTVNGTLGESGSETYSLGYGTTATLASNTGQWTQTGSGNVSANANWDYSYSGAGGGDKPAGRYYGGNWTLTSESGGGSGTSRLRRHADLRRRELDRQRQRGQRVGCRHHPRQLPVSGVHARQQRLQHEPQQQRQCRHVQQLTRPKTDGAQR